MNTITAIRDSPRQQVKIFLDGKPAFSLQTELAAREGLQVGQELSDTQIAALKQSHLSQRCLGAALGYLNYRPRSEWELRERLTRRGFASGIVTATIDQLKEKGLVNDRSFAQFWKDNRESFRPRSQRLTRLELRRKGVGEDIIDQVVTGIDDNESAYQAALSKIRSLSTPDYDVFRCRLASYLQRRGFSYRVIDHTVKQVWQEREKVSKVA
jgi:regulatory protein